MKRIFIIFLLFVSICVQGQMIGKTLTKSYMKQGMSDFTKPAKLEVEITIDGDKIWVADKPPKLFLITEKVSEESGDEYFIEIYNGCLDLKDYLDLKESTAMVFYADEKPSEVVFYSRVVPKYVYKYTFKINEIKPE